MFGVFNSLLVLDYFSRVEKTSFNFRPVIIWFFRNEAILEIIEEMCDR